MTESDDTGGEGVAERRPPAYAHRLDRGRVLWPDMFEEPVQAGRVLPWGAHPDLAVSRSEFTITSWGVSSTNSGPP